MGIDGDISNHINGARTSYIRQSLAYRQSGHDLSYLGSSACSFFSSFKTTITIRILQEFSKLGKTSTLLGIKTLRLLFSHPFGFDVYHSRLQIPSVSRNSLAAFFVLLGGFDGFLFLAPDEIVLL